MPIPRRILLTTFGSFGDLHPFMALALELQRRGHIPVIATSAFYRGKVESAGLEFAPVRPDVPAAADSDAIMRRAMNPRTGTEVVIREILLGNLEASYEDTLRAARGCDLVVSHGITYASPIVAEQLGLPWAYAALQPIILLSAIDPSVPPSAPWALHLRVLGPAVYRKLIELGTRPLAAWAAPVHALRDRLGLPRRGGNVILDGQFSPYLNLALFSRALAPAAADWPARTVQTGFAFYDTYDEYQQPLTPALEEFLRAGEPPVVFTLGTAAVRDAGRFFHDSLLAARAVGRRAVLLTGIETANATGLSLTADEIAVDYAPYAALFPRAAVNVHQGGIGTTAQALRAGRPMLIMPYAHDQPDNASRCERLGVARHVARARYTPASAAKALRALLKDTATADRAARIGRKVAGERGTERACDAIEELAAARADAQGTIPVAARA